MGMGLAPLGLGGVGVRLHPEDRHILYHLLRKGERQAGLVGHNGLEPGDLLLRRPAEYCGARSGDGVIMKAVSAGDIPLHQRVAAVHLEGHPGHGGEGVDLPPLPGAVEVEGEAAVLQRIAEVHGHDIEPGGVRHSQAADPALLQKRPDLIGRGDGPVLHVSDTSLTAQLRGHVPSRWFKELSARGSFSPADGRFARRRLRPVARAGPRSRGNDGPCAITLVC